MSLYFRWGGGALIIIAALFINREYKLYLDRRIKEMTGFIELLSHVEGRISRFLSYGDGLWRDFTNKALENMTFLPLIRGGESLSSAFEKTKEKSALPKDISELLSTGLKQLGQGYREGEVALLSELRGKMEIALEEEKLESEKNKKVISALLLGGALAVLILII